ncbi:distal tail protein Dit [Enterococcus casseliflavus]|uniref:distal tail protein Dit n=1 Tax=Enterococcus casseliflavus TaxID=37734 RepID=UPI0035CA979F
MESDLIIKFDDLILSDYFDLLGEPDMGLFAPVTNELVRSARGYGSQIKDSRSEANTITLPVFSTRGNWRGFKDDISVLARDKELHRIWFSHEPDRYYLGKLDGESKLVRSLERMNEATGSLTFIIPDGISYAVEEKQFRGLNNTLTIENNGTHKSPASFTVDFTENTDYLGFLTDKKIIQLGTVEDTDAATTAASTVIFNESITGTSNRNWSENVARIRHTPDSSTLSGRLTWRSDSVVATDFGSGEGYHGPSVTRFLGDDAIENWEATFRVGFIRASSNPKREQVGLLEGNILDADNNFIAGFNIKKPRATDERVEYAFYIGDNRVFLGDIPYNFRDFFGNVVIKKIGNKFVFSIGGFGDNWKFDWSYARSFTNDDVANLRAKSMSCYFGVWNWRPSMYLRMSYAKFIKINTNNLEEEALKFLAGDHLEITENLKVFLNGTPADDYLANGSDKLYFEPGTTEVLIASDKFPSVTATLRERYL